MHILNTHCLLIASSCDYKRLHPPSDDQRSPMQLAPTKTNATCTPAIPLHAACQPSRGHERARERYLCRHSVVRLQVTKYPQRNGVAVRDLLRLSHPKAADLGKRKREEDVDAMNLVLHYATHPADEVRNHCG